MPSAWVLSITRLITARYGSVTACPCGATDVVVVEPRVYDKRCPVTPQTRSCWEASGWTPAGSGGRAETDAPAENEIVSVPEALRRTAPPDGVAVADHVVGYKVEKLPLADAKG